MIYSKLSMQRYEKFREMQKEKAFFLFHTSDAATKKQADYLAVTQKVSNFAAHLANCVRRSLTAVLRKRQPVEAHIPIEYNQIIN